MSQTICAVSPGMYALLSTRTRRRASPRPMQQQQLTVMAFSCTISAMAWSSGALTMRSCVKCRFGLKMPPTTHSARRRYLGHRRVSGARLNDSPATSKRNARALDVRLGAVVAARMEHAGQAARELRAHNRTRHAHEHEQGAACHAQRPPYCKAKGEGVLPGQHVAAEVVHLRARGEREPRPRPGKLAHRGRTTDLDAGLEEVAVAVAVVLALARHLHVTLADLVRLDVDPARRLFACHLRRGWSAWVCGQRRAPGQANRTSRWTWSQRNGWTTLR